MVGTNEAITDADLKRQCEEYVRAYKSGTTSLRKLLSARGRALVEVDGVKYSVAAGVDEIFVNELVEL